MSAPAKTIRKTDALKRIALEAPNATARQEFYNRRRSLAVIRAQRLIAALNGTSAVVETAAAHEGDLHVVRITVECGKAQVPIQIDTSELYNVSDAGIEGLALFVVEAAFALSLCPDVIGAPHFRAVTPRIRDYESSKNYEDSKSFMQPQLCGVGVFYEESGETALFLPMCDYKDAKDADLADVITSHAPRALFSTPEKPVQTDDERRKWAAAMCMAPPRPQRQLTFP